MSLGDEIRRMVDEITMFNVHDHVAGFDWGIPPDDKGGKSLPQILFNDFLLYLTGAARYRGPGLGPNQYTPERAEEHWKAGRDLLEIYRPLTIYRTLRVAFKELYGFEGEDITDDNWREINDKVVATYRRYGQRRWLAEVLKRANISRIVQFCYLPYVVDHWGELNEEDRNLEKSFIRPSLLSDAYAFMGDSEERQRVRKRSFEIVGPQPSNYSEYLEAVAKAIAHFRACGGVGLKILASYNRDMHFQRVPAEEARTLYDRGPENLSEEEHLRLEDNLVWHLFDCARQSGLVVSFHTAYAVPTRRGNPGQLVNLISAFKDVTFDLCHAAWPYSGEHAILARSFGNVYYNLAWVPMLSFSLAKRELSEMMEIVPINKFLVGLDTGSAESCYGTAAVTRQIISEVLAEKVAGGAFTMGVAEFAARRLLKENAEEVFGVG